MIMNPQTDHVVVSDIVRSIVKSGDRQDLQNTADLDHLISLQLATRVSKSLSDGKRVLVDGVRQQSVLHHLVQIVDDIEYVWIDCADDVRAARYQTRQSAKDGTISFADADVADDKLGLKELEYWFKYVKMATIVKSD